MIFNVKVKRGEDRFLPRLSEEAWFIPSPSLYPPLYIDFELWGQYGMMKLEKEKGGKGRGAGNIPAAYRLSVVAILY